MFILAYEDEISAGFSSLSLSSIARIEAATAYISSPDTSGRWFKSDTFRVDRLLALRRSVNTMSEHITWTFAEPLTRSGLLDGLSHPQDVSGVGALGRSDDGRLPGSRSVGGIQ